MEASASDRRSWVLPVLLAVSTSAALVLGYLHVTRPSAGELGSVRVIVADDDGKAGNSIRVVVAEAPLAQKDTVAPGPAFTGAVNYPAPYLSKPHLKLTSGKRRYTVVAETESGFVWAAVPRPDDFRDDATKDSGLLEKLLGGSLELAASQGKLKPGLEFEDFTWEAKGLRAPPSALPPKTFEQKGKFAAIKGQEGVIFFPIPYASPPNVSLGGNYTSDIVVTECTAKSFKWRHVSPTASFQGEATWTARGVLGPTEGNK